MSISITCCTTSIHNHVSECLFSVSLNFLKAILRKCASWSVCLSVAFPHRRRSLIAQIFSSCCKWINKDGATFHYEPRHGVFPSAHSPAAPAASHGPGSGRAPSCWQRARVSIPSGTRQGESRTAERSGSHGGAAPRPGRIETTTRNGDWSRLVLCRRMIIIIINNFFC